MCILILLQSIQNGTSANEYNYNLQKLHYSYYEISDKIKAVIDRKIEDEFT